MISIIICSRESDIPEGLKNNIRETVGLEYELIIVDNKQHHQSIFKAYNYGVDRARYDTLCFLHDDILFHTPKWGEVVLDQLNYPFVGLIGVAGGVLAPRVPVQWNFGMHFVHVLQYKKRLGTSKLLEGASFTINHFSRLFLSTAYLWLAKKSFLKPSGLTNSPLMVFIVMTKISVYKLT